MLKIHGKNCFHNLLVEITSFFTLESLSFLTFIEFGTITTFVLLLSTTSYLNSVCRSFKVERDLVTENDTLKSHGSITPTQ